MTRRVVTRFVIDRSCTTSLRKMKNPWMKWPRRQGMEVNYPLSYFPVMFGTFGRGVVKLRVLEFCSLSRISTWKWLPKSCRLRTFTSDNPADFCWQVFIVCKCRSTHAATIKLFAEFWVATTGQEHPGKSVENPVTGTHLSASCDCLLRSLVSSTAHGKEGRGAQVQTFLRAFKDLRFDRVLWRPEISNPCSVTSGFEQSWLHQSPDLSRSGCECVTLFQRLRQILYSMPVHALQHVSFETCRVHLKRGTILVCQTNSIAMSLKDSWGVRVVQRAHKEDECSTAALILCSNFA